jgi:hypothetical protein
MLVIKDEYDVFNINPVGCLNNVTPPPCVIRYKGNNANSLKMSHNDCFLIGVVLKFVGVELKCCVTGRGL